MRESKRDEKDDKTDDKHDGKHDNLGDQRGSTTRRRIRIARRTGRPRMRRMKIRTTRMAGRMVTRAI